MSECILATISSCTRRRVEKSLRSDRCNLTSIARHLYEQDGRTKTLGAIVTVGNEYLELSCERLAGLGFRSGNKRDGDDQSWQE